MAIKMDICYINGKPTFINPNDGVKPIAIHIPEFDTTYSIRITSGYFYPTTFEKANMPDESMDIGLFKKHLFRVVSRHIVTITGNGISPDDCDFIRNDENAIIAMRVRLNSKRIFVVPITAHGSWIDNEAIRRTMSEYKTCGDKNG
jgi:hypothetical protein